MRHRKHREEEPVQQLSVRIPLRLYQQIEALSQRNRRSKGQEIVDMLEQALKEHRAELGAAEPTPDYGKPNGTDG